MRRHVLALSSLLLLAAGCSHLQPNAPKPPTLPASHARLSKALELYLDKKPEAAADSVPSAAELDEPRLVVEPEQARAVYDEAVAVLRGKPTPEETSEAYDDLRAACRAGLEEACDFARTQFERPEKISGPPPEFPKEAWEKGTFGVVVIRCQLGADGRFRGCKVLESGPDGLTGAVLAYTSNARYQPARIAGQPLSVPYTLTSNFKPFRGELTTEQHIQVAAARTQKFPKSPPAWARLATLLSRHSPEDPAFPASLRGLHAVLPSYWWPANELAWLHVQAGRHAEAAPLVRRALEHAPDNSYVLETSAAVLAATGQCEQALAAQRRAVEKLPAEWPAPERERFTRTLAEYQRQCAGAGTAPVQGASAASER